jgi:hypothetical protein
MYGVADNFCINSEPLQCSAGTSTTGTANNYWTVGATNIIALSSSSQATVSSPSLTGVSGGSGTAKVKASAGGCQDTGGGTPTVQIPTASAIQLTLSSGATTDCPSKQAGWTRVVSKYVTDQETPSQNIVAAGQSLTEVVTIGTPNSLNMVGPVKTGAYVTTATGLFSDTLTFCSPACPGTGTTASTQVITDVYLEKTYTVTPNSFLYSCTANTINGK